MNTLEILDCSLRDGGYINNWNFKEDVIKDIIAKLVNANIDLIEIGFLRDCEFDPNRTLFNNCKEIEHILPKSRKQSKFVAMALHNLYDINKLEKYDGKTIEYIRVTFHDYDIEEGLQYIVKVKEKGYKVFCNPINIMGYSDEKILEIIKKVNIIKPYAFSIVDTFGSMEKKDLIRIYSLCNNNLDSDIVIGIHLHENLNSSFALMQDFIQIKDAKRKHTCDGSLFGIGRVPGNLCIELLANYLNKNFDYYYDIDYLLDAIDAHIIKLKKIEEWGYSIAYALSAKYNLHRNYSEFLLKKGNLSSKQINYILSQIENFKKTAFDKKYIEKLYLDFQNRHINDSENLIIAKNIFSGKNILLLAPGITLNEYSDEINAYIRDFEPVVVALNFYTDKFKVDYSFFSNENRYSFFLNKIKEETVIITSNIENPLFKHLTFDYYNLAITNGKLNDSCVLMFLKLLSQLEIKEFSIAGFDGVDENSYYDDTLSVNLKKYDFEKIQADTRSFLDHMQHKMKINFLTPSAYEFK
ncbi:aldolase catalytic domain-containing protein [Campylobacter lari]|nr:aldolase catalytic domain-containing protein [Campylobacter lari]